MLSGASAGALAAVLAQCDVDTDAAYNCANRLAEEAGCFSNPLGLCGVWGRMVYAWLDALLPEDAAEHCTGRCRVVVTHTRTQTLALTLTFTLTLTLTLTLRDTDPNPHPNPSQVTRCMPLPQAVGITAFGRRAKPYP